jgi:uncharacterized repeat protein (TIGR03803 family)
LVEGPDGELYGTARATSTRHDFGIIFKISTNGIFTTLAHFNGTNGAYPRSGLLLAKDGNFYGTTVSGPFQKSKSNPLGPGTVFEMTPAGILSTLASFHDDDGANPSSELVEADDGTLLGITPTGGPHPEDGPISVGTIFKLTPDHTLTPIVFFAQTNGTGPFYKLVKGLGDNFYGTTESGGAHGRGTAFRVSPNGRFETLFNFGGTNGAGPNELNFGDDGNLYGTTGVGGLGYHGTVFKLSSSGKLATLFCFDGRHLGHPSGALVLGSDGNFYGIASSGGASKADTIFQVTKRGVLRCEYTFTNHATFDNASAMLSRARDGTLLGTTSDGGQHGCGSVFRVTLAPTVPDGDPIAQPHGLRPTNVVAAVGIVTNLEVWFRPSNDRQNASRLALYRYRTKDCDFFIKTYVASYETTLAGLAKTAQNTIAHARQMQQQSGTIPLLVFENREMDYWDGSVETTAGGALFYPDGQHRVPPTSREFSWDKYPGIPWTYGYSTNFDFHPEDVMVISIPLSWNALAINYLTIEPDPAEPFIIPTNFTYFKPNIVNDTNNLATAYKAYRAGKISKEEMMAVEINTLNDQPINFYGKLMDQYGDAVTNATVPFIVTVNTAFTSREKKGSVTSDANGHFEISGLHGQMIRIVPQKLGYALASGEIDFRYSRMMGPGFFVPDSSKPVVMRMWKLHAAEPLQTINKRFKIHWTNNPIFFDLLSGRIVTNGGDLRITVERAHGLISGWKAAPWSVKLEVIDGGLTNALGTERTTYFAPEAGYQENEMLSNTNKTLGGSWDGFHTGFYVKSRHGQVYSKLDVLLEINRKPDDPIELDLHGVANTNFSRNWEAAPGTFLKP